MAQARPDDGQRALIDEIIRSGGRDRIAQVVQLIQENGGLRDSMAVARQRSLAAQQALEQLPDTIWKEALLELAAYSISRNH